MPTLSRTEGLSWMVTCAHLLSKRPLALCTNRGWAPSSSTLAEAASEAPFVEADGASASCPGTQPRRAMSWQPLHTPRLKVSGLQALPWQLCIRLGLEQRIPLDHTDSCMPIAGWLLTCILPTGTGSCNTHSSCMPLP